MFFFDKKCKLKKDVRHPTLAKDVTLFDGIAVMMSGTIGAGILALPYVISQVGVAIGLSLLVFFGFLMIGLNLLIAEVALKTGHKYQLVGLARRYLGLPGEIIMAFVMYTVLFGVLVVYMIGVGDLMVELVGGNAVHWTLGFFCMFMIFIFFGMRTVKTVEFFLVFLIFCIIFFLSVMSSNHLEVNNLTYSIPAKFFYPYAAILFAFHGTTAVPEVYSIIKNKKKVFKKVIISGGLLTLAMYAIFSVMVVGVTGFSTTTIATVGLGNVVGKSVFLLGNVFAIIAMSTAFLMIGLSLRDSFRWDLNLPTAYATFLVLVVPLIIFLAGMRDLVSAIDLVGGIFMSLEIALLLLIYWRARHVGDVKGSKMLKHVWFVFSLVAFAICVGFVYNIITML